MSETLPDCMMPDGADPCVAYQELRADRDRLESIAKAQTELAERRLEWNQGLRADNARLSERAALVDELAGAGLNMLDTLNYERGTAVDIHQAASRLQAAIDKARADAAREGK